VLRFPNPGSHIDGFIKIYCELFDEFQSYDFFTLDDISRTLVDRNLATSSGYMGEEALIRSTRNDRSRDPLYNQSKMYAELFRMLGWFQSLPDSSLKYRVSFLGAHVATANQDARLIFQESILGIAFPNAVLDVKGNYILRPFFTILKTMLSLDNVLCRDEMIVGPLCLENDRNNSAFKQMVSNIKKIRGDFKKLQSAMKSVSTQRKISRNTMYNYTRFPLAVLVWCGWTKKERLKSIYNQSIVFQRLTPEGIQKANAMTQAIDLRSADFVKFNQSKKMSIARFCFYSMLARSGFNLNPLKNEIAKTSTEILPKILSSYTKEKTLIFSPFQEFNLKDTQEFFPETKIDFANYSNEKKVIEQARNTAPQLFSDITLEPKSSSVSTKEKSLLNKLKTIYSSNGNNVKEAIKSLIAEYSQSNKNTFYPLISKLFQVLGYDCDHSRIGVNYQRWDALITDKANSIPIEIKSPGEEQYISVKAIRQAIENKVILLSRKIVPTTPDTTSLVVGFYLPNDRSEVSNLIEDVYKIFRIKIGVIDFESLLKICYEAVLNNKAPRKEDLVNLYGFIKI